MIHASCSLSYMQTPLNDRLRECELPPSKSNRQIISSLSSNLSVLERSLQTSSVVFPKSSTTCNLVNTNGQMTPTFDSVSVPPLGLLELPWLGTLLPPCFLPPAASSLCFDHLSRDSNHLEWHTHLIRCDLMTCPVSMNVLLERRSLRIR
jgi:hypothetical protein